MAGACATILKAAFDGRVQFNTLPDGTIVTANENGHSLVSYTDLRKFLDTSVPLI